MATERDTYLVETIEAQRALQELGRKYLELKKNIDDTTKSNVTLASVMKDDLTKSFRDAHAQYDLLKEGFRETVQLVSEGVRMFLEEEKSILRVNFALRSAGADVDKYSEKLSHQAESLERLTGVSSEHIRSAQAMALTMGVGANEVERFTRVAFELAEANNTDVIPVMRALARANAEGKEELKKFGVVMENITTEGGGFGAVLAEAEKRVQGFSEAMPQAVKDSNALKKDWEDVQKLIGGAAVSLYSFLNQDTIKMRAQFELMQKVAALGSGARTLHDLGNDVNGQSFPVDVDMKAVEKERVEGEKRALAHKIFLQKQFDDERTLRDENEQREAEMNSEGLTTWKDVQEQKVKAARETAESLNDLAEATAKAQEDQYEQELDAAEKRYEAEDAIAEASAEKKRQLQQQQMADFKQYTTQVLNVGGNFLAEELQANTKFNREMFEIQYQREIVGMEEYQAVSKRAEMEQDLRNEKIASLEKELAATLASVAKDSAIKAIFETAAAIASFAVYDEVGAEGHLVAAGLYAGVAVAAGGAAYALSSTRGMTGEEKSRLDQEKERDREAAEREARQGAQRGGDTVAGTQISVFYMGIAGITEKEQGQELQRIQNEYASMATGSK